MDPQNARGAFRSSSITHVDEDMQTLFEQQLRAANKQLDDATRELLKIAALSDHPGWKLIREQFMKTIEEYRSGAKLKAAITDTAIDNNRLGEMTRVCNLVADELTTLINSVTVAEQEIERQKEENRNAASPTRL